MTKTSIQYQLSNNVLFNEVFGHWSEFSNVLRQGPDEMKKYLYEKWNYVKDELKKNTEIEIQDLDKIVTADDFNVTYNKTVNGTSVFFLTFPDYDYRDAASKYVALALTKQRPRYFTLEYADDFITHEPYWVVGEFVIEGNGKAHRNLAHADNQRLTWFAGHIIGFLEAEGL